MNLAYTFRVLRKNPLVTVSIILILGLAIASCVAIFAFVNSILFRPLAYKNSDSIVRFLSRDLKRSGSREYRAVSVPDLLDLQKRAKTLESIAYYIPTPFNLITPNDDPEIVSGLRVSGRFFPLLGINPQMGRVIFPEEDVHGKNGVVVLGHRIWQRRWAGDTGIVGKVIDLGGKPVEVVGVMPPSFDFPMDAELCMPAGLPLEDLSKRRDNRIVFGLARLAPEVDIGRAGAEIEMLSQELEREHVDSNSGYRIRVVPLHEEMVGNVRVGLYVLFGAVILVLLLACANVANLLLATAVGRQKEVAIRVALGASQWAVIRQCLLESTTLAFLSGMLGIPLSYGLIKFLIAVAPSNIPRLGEVSLGWQSFVFAVIASLAASILFGLLPGLQLARRRLSVALNEDNRGSSSGVRRANMRNALIIVEVALAFVLLIATGLLMKSFHRLNSVDPGFNPKNLVAAEVALPWERYSNPTNRAALYKGIVDRIKLEPGSYSAGMVSMLPFDGRGLRISFRLHGQPLPEKGRENLARYNPVGGDYFQTMQIPLLSGRFFDEWDTMDRPKVAIVSRSFADRFFGTEEPVGKLLYIEGQKELFQIVGVTGNVHQKSKSELPYPEIWFHYLQINDPTMTVVVRAGSSGMAKEAGPLIRKKVREMDAQQAAGKIIFMERLVRNSTAQSQFRLIIFNVLAVCALILASVGLYGNISYLVNLRTQEIGIRMALGAEPSSVKKMILAQGLKPAAFGLALGMIMAIWFSTYLRAVLFEVTPFDLTVYLVLTVLLLVLAILASYIPALRATRIDPVVALRNS